MKTEPTTGALRAAKAVANFPSFCKDVEKWYSQIASVIDAETGLPEILEALEYFETLLDAHYGSSFHHIGDGDGIDKEIADKMRNFIARIRKAEQK